jgi:hypothetical protein
LGLREVTPVSRAKDTGGQTVSFTSTGDNRGLFGGIAGRKVTQTDWFDSLKQKRRRLKSFFAFRFQFDVAS